MSGSVAHHARLRVWLIGVALAFPVSSRADAPMFDDDTWRYTARDSLALDGGLVVGFPVALPTGLVRGVEGGVTWGRRFALGARAAYARASESSEAWLVAHHEASVRVTGGVQHFVGRGLVGLRLGAGASVVHERRTRHQGMRAGLMGDALSTSANALFPVASLEAVVGLQIRGPWRLQLAGGPRLVLDDVARGSWSATAGIGWQP